MAFETIKDKLMFLFPLAFQYSRTQDMQREWQYKVLISTIHALLINIVATCGNG